MAWILTLPLVIDKRLDFWPAMRLSRRIVSKHWWKFLGFGIVLVLFNLAGLLVFCVGVAFTFPVSLAALMYAYEDIFAAAGAKTVEPAEPGSAIYAEGQLHDQPARWTVILMVLLAAFLVVCVSSALGTLTTFRGLLVAGVAATAFAAGILLLIRKSHPRPGFLVPFLFAFLLVFGAGSFITSVQSNSFVSTARIKLTPTAPETAATNGVRTATSSYDPYRLQTELEVIQSEVILDGVIEALDLSRKWGRRFSRGHALKHAETLALLRQRLNLRPVRHTSIVEISVFDDKPDEAAKIANEIARAYGSRTAPSDSAAAPPSAFQVEIIDQAMPAHRPVRPNRPLNLVLAAVAGLLLGLAAGATRVALSARNKHA